MGGEASTQKTVIAVLTYAGLINVVGYLAAFIIGCTASLFGWVLLISALMIPTVTLKDSRWYGVVSNAIFSIRSRGQIHRGAYSRLAKAAVGLFLWVTVKASVLYGAGRILHWIFA